MGVQRPGVTTRQEQAKRQWSAEARLLYDLQKACVDSEREVYALDLVEWALSIGKRPIKRDRSPGAA